MEKVDHKVGSMFLRLQEVLMRALGGSFVLVTSMTLTEVLAGSS